MRVLVTGGAGFIGSHVVEMLAASGRDVCALDVAPRPSTDLVGDLRDPDTCDFALRGVDVVCHQAARVGLGVDLQDLPGYVSTNDLGTATLLAAMARAGVRRLVLASSMVVYGEGAYSCPQHGSCAAPPREERDLACGRFEPRCPVCGAELVPGLVGEDARLDPRNVYAATKVAQEHLAGAWARASGGTVVALRYHNVYGPRMPTDTSYAGVAALFASRLMAGNPPLVREDGEQRRDFVHVRDVASANAVAVDLTGGRGAVRPGRLRAYNVGSGQPRTVGALARALSDRFGGPDPVVTGGYELGDVRHVTATSDRLRAEGGWQPVVGLQDGIGDLATSLAGAGP